MKKIPKKIPPEQVESAKAYEAAGEPALVVAILVVTGCALVGLLASTWAADRIAAMPKTPIVAVAAATMIWVAAYLVYAPRERARIRAEADNPVYMRDPEEYWYRQDVWAEWFVLRSLPAALWLACAAWALWAFAAAPG